MSRATATQNHPLAQFRILFTLTAHSTSVNTLSANLQTNQTELKKRLPAEDILCYSFQTENGTPCLIVYADGIVNKELLGELVARPLSALILPQDIQNEHTRYALNDKNTPKSSKDSNKNSPQPTLADFIKSNLLSYSAWNSSSVRLFSIIYFAASTPT